MVETTLCLREYIEHYIFRYHCYSRAAFTDGIPNF